MRNLYFIVFWRHRRVAFDGGNHIGHDAHVVNHGVSKTLFGSSEQGALGDLHHVDIFECLAEFLQRNHPATAPGVQQD